MSFLTPLAGPLGIAGAGLSAVGAIEGGLSTSAQAQYQSQVAENNKTIANQNAAYAAAAGSRQAADASMRSAATGGRIKAAQAANNIDVNTGSAVEVQKSEREVGQLSSLTAQNNALLQAYGYRSAATSYGAQAGLDVAAAAQAPIGATIGAAGGLLGNASALGYKYNTSTSDAGGNLAGADSTGMGVVRGGIY